MSKVNQIQQALLELAGGEFQKLADAYLVERGLGRVNSIGSVIAANKVRKGTPDTLVVTPDGRYIFAEHTTTPHPRLLEKLREDLGKCFDEEKVGIPVDQIERVVFCFTSKLNVEEENELAQACREMGVNLDLFGIDAFSFDLYTKYPNLARDFLGVQIDTGQIVAPERFISLYNSNKTATPLDLGFHFREEELSHLLDALEDEKLITVSGRAGVGKSRLALEACRRFKDAHPEYEVMCVFGRNRDLWEDLQSRFRRPGKFLILVDDANRVSRFDYVVDLLQYRREDRDIKVVATVRDYALSKVRQAARPLGGHDEVELGPFTDEQVKELITDEFGIHNYHYLERIADIARGNPRLAVMAAEVAKEGSLRSIHDVSALYDTYFSSIREDLQGEGADLANADLLKVAAIVSFFKAVDRTNEEIVEAIEQAFDVTRAVLWEAADRLHDLEVLDMHEDEVVRVSDQVLGTYLFYLAVFKESVLDFGDLLHHFFPRLQHRLTDSINPVLSAFDSESVTDAMRPHVERAWSKLEAEGDDEGLLHLLDVFWFTKRTDTLLWARERIEEMPTKPADISGISFEKSSNTVPSPSLLSLLRPFAFVEQEEARIALDLLSRYLTRRPSEVPAVLRVLIDDYGFRPDSYLREFKIQKAVVDVIWDCAKAGDALFSRLFLAVATNYLGTQFENHVMKDSSVLHISRFDLPATSELASLRKSIWQRLFAFYQTEELHQDVLGVINAYNGAHLRLTNSEVVKTDAREVLPALQSMLDPDDYRHCVVLHNYLDQLERHDVEVPNGLRERFRCDTFALAETLLPQWGERRASNLSYQQYEEYKQDQLKQHTAEYALEDYARFFDQCLEIHQADDKAHHKYLLQQRVVGALLALANRDSALYWQVVDLYLSRHDPLTLPGYALVQKLVEEWGFDRVCQFLTDRKYPTKVRWLFHLHEVLPADAVNEEKLDHLYDLYRTGAPEDLPRMFDYLLKYVSLDTQVVSKTVAIVLDKADSEPGYAHALTMVFNSNTEIAQQLPELFAGEIDLLKRAYLAVDYLKDYGDYEGEVFDSLLDLDADFISEYIAWKYENAEHGWLSSHDDPRDYDFIWAREDHQEMMDRVVEAIYEHEQRGLQSINPYLAAFFQKRDDSESAEEVRRKQDRYLLRLIDKRSNEIEFMKYLFGLISQFSPDRRRTFVESFVQLNDSFQAFERLPLEPSLWTWQGSQVPMLQARIDYWDSLLRIMNTVNLLPHKQYIERQIQKLHGEIEHEKKRDFMGD